MTNDDVKKETIRILYCKTKLAKLANTPDPTKITFSRDDLNVCIGNISSKITNKNGYYYVYEIILNDNSKLQDIIDKYNEFKNKQETIKELNKDKEIKEPYDRLTPINEYTQDIFSRKEIVLYVGSSKDISERLKQHIYCGSKTTYGLKLMTWMENVDFSITVNIYEYDKNNFELIIHDIEMALWNIRLPVFGEMNRL